ncbi:hypothetical protein EDC01DRAFT_621019 [Geopyxis carbonaria]|nr:hypothetical protein EDC01DRAFT_621019 [Geopyxis carbonaria]
MLRAIPRPPPRTMFKGDNINGPPHHSPVQLPPSTLNPSISSQIASRTYKTCKTLFLTRRLPEALAGLQTIIHGPPGSIISCSRSLRIKIWCLYLAILDAASKMSASEGKATWGQQEWPQLIAKTRTGSIWDDVNHSYGDEGRVDAEVVTTLATLLLSHSPDQTITQKRIETYIGATPIALSPEEDSKSVLQRVKLTEIYILHVLPRVGEWEYAREFTQLSPDIDEEQKESFYTTLEALQKDREETELQSRELEKQRDEELEWERQQEENKKRSRSSPPDTGRRSSRVRGSSVRPASRAGPLVEESPAIAKSRRPSTVTKEKRGTIVPQRKAKTTGANSTLITSTTAILSRIHAHMATPSGPFSMLRTVLMLAMVAWMTSNKKVRERVRRLLIISWIKMTRTVGMGMKVTYV